MSDGPFTLVLMAHDDHDPALTCRPALGYGLCEVLVPEDLSDEDAAPDAREASRPADAGTSE